MQLPGRVINPDNRIVINRVLPANGEVLVQPGQRVEALTVIARAEIPCRYRVIDVARQLNQPQVDMKRVMRQTVGQPVQANEVLAAASGGLPFLQRSARAPVAGYIAAIGPGWALLETERAVIEIQAFINGLVTQIIPQRGAVIEAHGAIIEAACGFGGEAYGRLYRLVNSPEESLLPEDLTETVKQAIIVGGRSVDEAVLRQAEALQVRAIIVGSLDAGLLELNPPVKVRVVATEGFGYIPMSPYTFGLLTALNGREVSVRGQTPLITPAADPPVILATSGYNSRSAPTVSAERDLKVGSRVRVIWGEFLGLTGHIDSLPAAPQPTTTGIIASGAYVNIDNQVYFIPWANLEQVN
jgi:hypothetical protein